VGAGGYALRAELIIGTILCKKQWRRIGAIECFNKLEVVDKLLRWFLTTKLVPLRGNNGDCSTTGYSVDKRWQPWKEVGSISIAAGYAMTFCWHWDSEELFSGKMRTILILFTLHFTGFLAFAALILKGLVVAIARVCWLCHWEPLSNCSLAFSSKLDNNIYAQIGWIYTDRSRLQKNANLIAGI